MKCKQAVAFRQNYTTQKAQLEAVVHECEDEINVVAQSGMPVAERIQKFKVSHPFFSFLSHLLIIIFIGQINMPQLFHLFIPHFL
jgi:hypothetical protein